MSSRNTDIERDCAFVAIARQIRKSHDARHTQPVDAGCDALINYRWCAVMPFVGKCTAVAMLPCGRALIARCCVSGRGFNSVLLERSHSLSCSAITSCRSIRASILYLCLSFSDSVLYRSAATIIASPDGVVLGRRAQDLRRKEKRWERGRREGEVNKAGKGGAGQHGAGA